MEIAMVIAMQANALPKTGAGLAKKDGNAKDSSFGKVMQNVQGQAGDTQEAGQTPEANLLSILAASMPVINQQVPLTETNGAAEQKTAVGGVIATQTNPAVQTNLAQVAENMLAEQGRAPQNIEEPQTVTEMPNLVGVPLAVKQEETGKMPVLAGKEQLNAALTDLKKQEQVAVNTTEDKQTAVTISLSKEGKEIGGEANTLIKQDPTVAVTPENASIQPKEVVQQMLEAIPVAKQAEEKIKDVPTIAAALQEKIVVKRDVPQTKAESEKQANAKDFVEKTTESLKTPLLDQSGAEKQFSAQSEAEPEMEKNLAEMPKSGEQQTQFSGVFAHQVKTMSTLDNGPTQAAAQQQPTAVKDQYQVISQIVNQAKLINFRDRSEMVIKLNPEHLGEMTLKISVDNGSVTASFHTDNSDVRRLLESSMPQLRTDLANQGFKVDSVDIYAGLDHSLPDGQQQGGQQREAQQQQHNKHTEQSFLDSIEEISRELAEDEDGVDYRV